MKTWDERAKDCIAQGCLTYSKRSDQFVKGVYPTHITKAEGCCLYDETGKKYYDFIGGLGSNIINCNNNFSLPTIKEVLLAEKIKSKIPFIDKLRFLKTGSEACSAAIKIARAYTLRTGVIGHGYHGQDSMFIAEEKPGTGCIGGLYSKLDSIVNIVEYIEAIEWHNIPAAVIIEPVQLDMSDHHIENIKKLRSLCTQNRIVLIFDEVITGFRTPEYCMSQYFNIIPDLICLGKAMANGFPISVVGGKKEIMDSYGYFISSTFAGEESAIDAANQTIDFLTDERIKELWKAGIKFQERFNKLSGKIKLYGIPTKAVFKGEELFKNLFWQEMCKHGFLLGKAWHIMFAHLSEEYEGCPTALELLFTTSEQVIKEIESGNVKLEGELAQEVFKRY